MTDEIYLGVLYDDAYENIEVVDQDGCVRVHAEAVQGMFEALREKARGLEYRLRAFEELEESIMALPCLATFKYFGENICGDDVGPCDVCLAQNRFSERVR